MTDLTDLENELKHLIIETLMLEDVVPEEIPSDQALFAEGLGLDSIDALELGMAIAKKYRIRLSQQADENRRYFYSVRSLAAFVHGSRHAEANRADA